ncbi:hypothetical protein Pint_19635 [Pistacia integerrima]|uniref:Uncharacterized protein n=1 Tax=Pistacia integerrima TaxID=434235 RepID=A0ACC0XC28_9ROSI|nr:hypothetical protein Pint_19635 [Pistacia integerrima]
MGFEKGGVLRESNSRPLAPEARIIPLDQTPTSVQTKNLFKYQQNLGETTSLIITARGRNWGFTVPLLLIPNSSSFPVKLKILIPLIKFFCN